MFLIGVLPAFLTLWIRYGMPESASGKAYTSAVRPHASRRRQAPLRMGTRPASPCSICSATRRAGAIRSSRS